MRDRLYDTRLGQRIQEQRKLLGITATDLASSTGFVRQTIHKMESGARAVQASELEDLARHLSVSVSWLVTGEGESGNQMEGVLRSTISEAIGILSRGIAPPLSD